MKKKESATRIALNRETLQRLDARVLPRAAGGETNSYCSECLRLCLSGDSGCC